MNSQELIEKLKEKFKDVSKFNDNYGYYLPKEYYSETLIELANKSQEAYEVSNKCWKVITTPYYSDNKKHELNNTLEYQNYIKAKENTKKTSDEFNALLREEEKEYAKTNELAYYSVDEHGGSEGDGEYYLNVLYFPNLDIYLKVVGTYRSHEGLEFYGGWDDVTEVRPKEKVIKVYE